MTLYVLQELFGSGVDSKFLFSLNTVLLVCMSRWPNSTALYIGPIGGQSPHANRRIRNLLEYTGFPSAQTLVTFAGCAQGRFFLGGGGGGGGGSVTVSCTVVRSVHIFSQCGSIDWRKLT